MLQDSFKKKSSAFRDKKISYRSEMRFDKNELTDISDSRKAETAYGCKERIFAKKARYHSGHRPYCDRHFGDNHGVLCFFKPRAVYGIVSADFFACFGFESDYRLLSAENVSADQKEKGFRDCLCHSWLPDCRALHFKRGIHLGQCFMKSEMRIPEVFMI